MNTVFLVDLNTKCYNVTHLFNQYIYEHKQRKLMIIQLQFDIVIKKESQ